MVGKDTRHRQALAGSLDGGYRSQGLQPGKSTLTESLAREVVPVPAQAVPTDTSVAPVALGTPDKLPRLELRPSQLGPLGGQQASPHAAPPRRVADSGGEHTGEVNAAIKVVVRFDDGETRTWSGKGHWGNGLAPRYTASREGYRPQGQWIWQGDEVAQRAIGPSASRTT